MSVPPIPIKTEEVILESADYNSAEELEGELTLQLEDSGGESYHIQYSESPQRQRHHDQLADIGGGSAQKNIVIASGSSNKGVLESEKRMRREIANSNERRRMQSINAGFQNLRALLPRHEGEKLSKAAILQQTSQYICELEAQKTQLLGQNSQLKRLLGQHDANAAGSDAAGAATGDTFVNAAAVAIKKRKLTDNIINIQTISDSSDEGLGSMSPEPMTLLNATGATSKAQVLNSTSIIAHNATKDLLDTKKQLDKERRMRALAEEELQMIKRQLYSVATAPNPGTSSGAGSSYIQREVIEHTDNLVRDVSDELPPGTVSYVEIDEMGQQQVVICSGFEELESDSGTVAAEIIGEEQVQEEVILSSTSSTESEHEINVIAKAYAEGNNPNSAALQPILQAAIKATPKVEVERINETIMKVKTEKIEPTTGVNRSRQNLETIVEAIRHLEGDHMFSDVGEQQKHQQQQQQKSQDVPLALTTKQQQAQAQRTTINDLRPFLQLKANKQVTLVGSAKKSDGSSVTPTAIFKVQTSSSNAQSSNATTPQQVTITTSALKQQCRPGVIVAKQVS